MGRAFVENSPRFLLDLSLELSAALYVRILVYRVIKRLVKYQAYVMHMCNVRSRAGIHARLFYHRLVDYLLCLQG